MKKNTVIMIIVAALLSMFLLGMNPLGQTETDPTQEDTVIYITSSEIGGYSNPHKVTFISNGTIIQEKVVSDGVTFGQELPVPPAREGCTCYGWLMADGTYLEADTPITQTVKVTADYETFNAFSRTASVNGLTVTVNVPENTLSSRLIFSVTAADAEAHHEKIQELFEQRIGGMKAVDTGFFDRDDNEVTLPSPVSLAINVDEKNSDAKLSLIKIASDGTVTKLAENSEDGSFTIETSDLSAFAVVEQTPGTISVEASDYMGGRSGVLVVDGVSAKAPVAMLSQTGTNSGVAILKSELLSKVKNPTIWSFIPTGRCEAVAYGTDCYYQVLSSDGYYLSVSEGGISLSESPADVFVGLVAHNVEGSSDNKFALMPSKGSSKKVDLKGNGSANGGFQMFERAEFTSANELFYITSAAYQSTEVEVYFNIGGGDFPTPASITGYTESTIKLPNYFGHDNGHAFLGWSPTAGSEVAQYLAGTQFPIPAEVQDNKITLYAVYDDITRIVFDSNGGDTPEFEYYDESMGERNYPSASREGYRFLGWAENKKSLSAQFTTDMVITPPTEEKTLYAVWAKTAKVTFVVADGTVVPAVIEGDAGEFYDLGTLIITLNKGYDFTEWKYFEDNGQEVRVPKAGVFFIPDNDTTLYAVSRARVTFDVNGGNETLLPVNEEIGKKISLPTISRDGYIFKGWKDASGKIWNDSYQITQYNTQLTAVWGYTISFDVNGGSVAAPVPISAIIGEGQSFPAYNGKKNNKAFAGWSPTAEVLENGTIYQEGAPIPEFDLPGTVFYAVYYVDISLSSNGGSSVGPSSKLTDQVPGTTVDISGFTAERNNKVFLGWSKANKNKDIVPNTFVVPNAGQTLYAVWGARVTFDANGHESEVTSSMPGPFIGSKDMGQTFTVPRLNDIPGHTFLGWTNKASLEGNIWKEKKDIYQPGDVITYPSDNTTLYAAWVGYVRVSFDVNGGTEDSSLPGTQNYADSITLPPYNGTKDGYKFIGWALTSKLAQNTYYTVYPAGTIYEFTSGTPAELIFYTAWDAIDESEYPPAKFGLRLQKGSFGQEPSQPNRSEYTTGKLKGKTRADYEVVNVLVDNGVKNQHWVLDQNRGQIPTDYYIHNNVTESLTRVPTVEEISRIMENCGMGPFDPQTQFVHWYVLKYSGEPEIDGKIFWHVDGTVIERDKATLDYDYGLLPTDLRGNWMIPEGYQVPVGSEAEVGRSAKINGNKFDPYLISGKAHYGWSFTGWNTAIDGSGTAYSMSDKITMTSTAPLVLFAQWQHEDIEIRVQKVWEGEYGHTDQRPESVVVKLLANGKPDSKYGSGVALNEANDWTYSVRVDKYDAKNQEIQYTWEEPSVANYKLISNITTGESTVITNRLVTTEKVTKIWDDENDRDGLRPTTLAVHLSNGTSVTLSAANNWSAEVKDLPVYEAAAEGQTGGLINYTWTEEPVEGYEFVPSESGVFDMPNSNGHETRITNKINNIASNELKVKKVWDDGNDINGIRPSSLTVNLIGDDGSTRSVVLNEDNEWEASLTVPEYWNGGTPINYTWSEVLSNSYYSPETLTDGQLTTLTNSLPIVTITANSKEKKYDGSALVDRGITATGLREGDRVKSVLVTGSQTEVGSSDNVPTNAKIVNASGSDVTAGYVINYVNGTLSVTNIPLMITAGSGSKVYDGTPLVVGTYTRSTKTPLAEGDYIASVVVDGSQTVVGTSENIASNAVIKNANGDDVTDSYSIKYYKGSLEITKKAVTITASSADKVYDGTELTDDGFTGTGLGIGDSIESVTISGSQISVGSSANAASNAKIVNDQGADVTSSYIINYAEGTLEVTPKALTITADTDTKVYDGSALTKNSYKHSDLVEGDAITTVTITGSQTDSGSSSNTPSAAVIMRGTEDVTANYTIEFVAGTLTVTQRDLTITGTTDNKTYDGAPLTYDQSNENAIKTKPAYTVTGLADGDTLQSGSVRVSGAITNVGNTPNVPTQTAVVMRGETNVTGNYNIRYANGTLTIDPKPVTITTGTASKEYDGTPLTSEEVSIAGLVDGESVELTATGSITEIGTADNTYDISWTNAAEANYAVTDALGKLTITENTREVTLTAATDSKTYDGAALTNAGVTAAGLPEGFTAEASAAGSQTYAGSSANVVNDGFIIKNAAGENKTANFTNVKKVDGTLTVNKAPVTITTGSATGPYTGSPLTNPEASITGLVNGDSAVVTATGSQTEVGSSTNTYEINWGSVNTNNYTVTENLGTLTIDQIISEVTLTAASREKTYDGSELSDSTVTVSGLPAGFTVEAVAAGSQTDAGESENVVQNGYIIRNAAGEDKTSIFTNVKKVNGSLKVNPAVLTVTTGSASKQYDGTALVSTVANLSGLVGSETATVTATGSQTEVGTTDNTYAIAWGTAKETNYTISETLGQLTVNPYLAQITLTAGSGEKTYDGSVLENSTVTAAGLPEGFTVEATAGGSQTNAGSSVNAVNDGYIIKNAAGEDKTAFFTNVKTVNGILTVKKAALTITTGSDSKEYDGTALVNAEASITGLMNNETAAVTATGSQTEVGSSSNSYAINWGATNKDNYAITENLGTLAVTPFTQAVTLTAGSGEKTYDGKELVNNTVTAAGLPDGFTIVASASGSQKNKGESANVVNDGYVIKNAQGVDKTANFKNVTKIDGKLIVNPAPLTVITGSASKKFDGSPLTNTADSRLEGLVNWEYVHLTTTGTIRRVGSTTNTYTLNWGGVNKDNYTLTENLGTLTITGSDTEVILTAASGSKDYNGTELKNSNVTASGLPNGIRVVATASGSQTNAGESANVVDDGYRFYDWDNNDVTDSFTKVTKVNGKLIVNPIDLWVTTEGGWKYYDGKPLTNNTVRVQGLINPADAVFTATGSQTEVGSSKNTYTVTWAEGKAGNYKIQGEYLGDLVVQPSAAEVIILAGSARKTYDGIPLTNDEYTVTGLPEGFTVEATTKGSRLDTGTGNNDIDTYIIRNAQGEDKTSSFHNVVRRPGQLTIDKAPLKIITGSGSKPYDGTPLTVADYTVEGLAEGESVTIRTTGSITEVGTTPNNYSIEWSHAKAENYYIDSVTLGTLEITPVTAEVVLTAASDSKIYDGIALTNSGVTATGLPEGFTVEATANGSQTDAGSSKNVVNDNYVIKNARGENSNRFFTNVTKVDGILTVTKAPVTIKTGSDSKEYDGTALTSNVTSIEGLVNNEKAIVTATGSQTEIGSSTNTYSIEWGTAKSSNYTVSEELGTLTVTENTAKVTLTAPTRTKTYDGTALSDSTVTVTGLPEGFTYGASASGSQTDAGESANTVNSGYKFFDKNGNDKTASFTNVEIVNGTLTVTPKAVTITTGSASKAYDGKALVNEEASITGLVEGESVALTATGTITEVGSETNTYSITWDNAKAANYTVTENLGTLTITANPVKVTLTAGSSEKPYDGTELTNGTVTAAGLPEGFTVEASTKGSQKDAGESANVINKGYVIKNSAGEDKTANFTNVETIDGTLTVTKVTVTITTGSGSKEYDGTALTVPEASITGLVNNETVTLKATGSQTEVGESTNSYDLAWGRVNKDNYIISEDLGTLTVTKNSAAVTLTAPTQRKDYDGSALEDHTVTVTGLPEGFTYEASASGSQTDAGTSDNTVNEGYKFFDADHNDKTENFTNVTVTNGKLTVNKIPVTITTGSASKAYDGTALVKDEANIEGLIAGETVTLAATGSIIEVGSTQNTYSITWDNANADNYTVTENLGTLTITDTDAEVVLTAASDSKTYDGTELVNAGVTAAGLPEGFTVEATASGSQTDAGSSANVVNDGYIIRNAAGEDRTANFTKVTKVDGTLTVNPKAVTITTGSDSKAYDGTALTKDEASIDGLVSGESVTLAATGTITEVGSTDNTYSITWDNAKADNYAVTENLGTLTITANAAEVKLIAATDSKTYDGTALVNSNVTAEGLPAGFTYSATASGSQTDAGSSANVVNDGYVIRNAAGEDKTANFTNVVKVDGTLTVNPKAVTITTGSDSKAYDGTALTNDEVSIDGLVDGESVTLVTTGTITEVGSTDNTYAITWTDAKEINYTITDQLGTLTITTNEAEVKLTAATDSKTYDGTALVNSNVTAAGLPAGFTFTATASGSQTDAGTSQNVVNDGYRFFDAAGNDKTANFTNVVKVEGTLTVNKAPVTITTGSGEKAYDGTALTNAEASIFGLVNGEHAVVTATGSQTEVGSSTNTYSIDWGTVNTENYEVTETLGTLTVTANAAEITLTAATDSKIYDGDALTNAEVKAKGLPEGFTYEATASGSQLNVGTSDNVVNDGYKFFNAAGEDKTANFTTVTKINGTLTVNPKAVTITTGSAEKKYDGTPLTNEAVTIEGLVEGETVTLAATGTITDIGETPNTYSITWNTAKAGNYTVTDELGTLKVTINNDAVTLTAASDSQTYNGQALTNSTVTVTGLPEGFTYVASASGSQTNAGSSDNVVNAGYKFYDANGNDRTASFANVTVVNGTLTVNKAPVTITTGSASKAYDGTALTNDEAGITGLVEGESVTLAATGTITEVGSEPNTYSITWDGASADNYTVTENLGTLTITKRDATVTLTAASGSKTYDGSALTNAVVTATGLPQGFTYEATASGSQTDAGSSDNVVNDGYRFFDPDGNDKTENFTNVEKVNGTLTVNPKAVTIMTGSDSKKYDGTALTNAIAEITGLVEGESVALAATGSIIEVGNTPNTYSIAWDNAKEANYTVTENLGTLTVTDTDVDVVLTAASGSKTYDGTALTNDVVTAAGLPEGFTYEAKASGSQTDAGSSANVVNDGYRFFDANGNDRTAYFTNVQKIDGTLTMNPKAVTITTGSASKEYDGTALTKDDASIEGLVDGETVTLAATGAITEIGETTNTYSITWDNAKAANYSVTENLGTLSIYANTADVVLTAASDSKDYDGTALTKNVVTAAGLPEGFTYEATASGSQTDAGSSANTVDDGYKFFNAAGADKTANFTNVKKVDGTLTVNPIPAVITTGSAGKAYDGTVLTKDEASITGLVEGESVTLHATGSIIEVGSTTNIYEIEWDEAKSGNYTVTENLGTLTITANNAAVVLTAASDRKTYDGSALTNSVVTAEGLPEGFTIEASASGSQTDAGESANVVNAGFIIRNADGEDRTANFTNISTVDGTLTVNKAVVTITTGSGSKEYDGTALTAAEAGISGLVDGETAVVTATGSQTEVGSSDNTYSIDWGTANENNYEIVEELGTLTVTETTAEVILTAASDSKTYDGTALINSTVTAEGLPEGFTYEATASGSQTDAGESANTVNDGYKFFDANGKDKTANFLNVTKVPGTLTVSPKAVTVTTGSDSKQYDGTALTNSEISIDGLVAGESVTLRTTGSIIEIGEADNTYSLVWSNAKESNYTVTDELGTLTITANDAAVILTAASESKTYDGTELTKNVVTADGLPEGFTIEASTSGSQTDAGESANVVNAGYIIRNAAGEDRTANFTNVSTVNGTLTVTKAPVTITTGSATAEYNGKALTAAETSISGLVNGETAAVTATGSQLIVGSSTNTYDIDWGKVKADNYEITEKLGTLTVTPNTTAIILTAASDSKTYDGTELTNNEVTVKDLPEGFTYEATASGTQTNAGSSANVVSSYRIFDADGNDSTEFFTNVSIVDGALTVNKAPVTITTGSASKAYDGTALTNGNVTIEGLVDGESVTLNTTGTITEVGSTPNTYTIAWDSANADNYTVTEIIGTLTITNNDVQVILTAASASKNYDGTVLEDSTVTVTGLPAGFTITATASGSQLDAGSSANVVDDGYRFFDAGRKDRTANFTNVQKIDGRLTVNPIPVTIKTGSDSKAYDGTPLTNAEVSISGLVEGENVTLAATGTITEVGSVDNIYSIVWDNAKSGNYTVTDNLGKLTITTNGKAITLTAGSDSKIYDGTELTNSDVTVDWLPEGFTFEAVTSGSQTNAGEAENVVTSYVIRDADGNDKTANFTNVITVPGALTVTPKTVTITTESGSKEYDGSALTVSETSIEGLVSGETAVVTATGSQTEVGSSTNTYTIDWGTANEDNYVIVEKLGTLTVNKTTAAVTLTAASDLRVYNGAALTNANVTAAGLPGGFTYEASASGSQTDAGEHANVVNSGYKFFDTEGNDKTANFLNVETVNGTLTVTPKEITVTTGNASKVYDGTPLTNSEVSADGLVAGESVTLRTTGSITEVGEDDNTYTITWDHAKAGNYTVTDNLGKLVITTNGAAVTLTAASDSKTYDGTPLTNGTVTANGLPAGFTITAVTNGTQTDAGSSANEVVSYVILDRDGNDKTANFTNVTTVAGTLTVNKAVVTITTGSGSKPYDGTPLTNENVTIEGLPEGESVTLTATGTITTAGSTPNTYSIDWTNANADNYTVVENLGTLTVTTNDAQVVLTAGDASKTYDGAPLSNHEVTVMGLPEGFTFEAVVLSSQTNAGSSDNVITGYVIKDADGVDRTMSFTNVALVPGKLTVNPKAVTITTGSDSKAYDGIALTKHDARIDGLAAGESIRLAATGTQTEVGSSTNTYSIVWNNADPANYTVTENLGTLTVTPNNVLITITAGDGSKTYDGTELTVDDTTISGLPEGFTYEAVTEGSQTNAGESPNEVTSYVIRDADGNDKTANFTNVTTVEGTLTVEKAPITVTTGSGSKAYDGTELTVPEASISGLLSTEEGGVTITTTGTITEVGSEPNTYVIDWGTVDPNNYDLSEVIGTLTVTTNNTPVNLTASSDTRVYDGTPLTSSAVAYNGLPEGFYVEAVTEGSQTTAGESANVVSEGWVIRNSAGEDKTANFTNVKLNEGKLTVTQMALTITADGFTRPYDGTPLTVDTYTSTDTAAGDSIESVTITGSQLNVSRTFVPNNVPSNAKIINAAGEDVTSSYKISYLNGLLVVTPKPLEITADSARKIYDGTPLVKDGYSSTALAEGDVIESVTITGERTDVGVSDNVPSETRIVNAEGRNVTGNYMITNVRGKLTVDPRKVVVTADNITKEFGQLDGEFTATVTGTVGDDTVEYEFSREEGEAAGTYTINVTGEENQGNYVVVYQPGTMTITYNPTVYMVTKVWNDDNNRDGIRPVSLLVTLVGSDGSVRTRRLSEANGWKASIDDLSLYYEGSEIVYTWSEEAVDGYTSETQVNGHVTTFINSHEIARTAVSVNKVWDDMDNAAGVRPSSLSVVLRGNGSAVFSGSLNDANGWTLTVNNLPFNENGMPIDYTWSEQALYDGYYPVSSVRSGTSTTFTNSNLYDLTIHYVYSNNEVAAPDYTVRQPAGIAYSVDSPVIEGYTANQVTIVGEQPARNVMFAVIYTPDGDPIVTPEAELVPTVVPTTVPVMDPVHQPEVQKDVPEPRVSEPDEEHPIVVSEPNILVDIEDMETALGLGEVFTSGSGYAME